MSDKLPHERLREWADIGKREGFYPSSLMDVELTSESDLDPKLVDFEAFRKLAGEIERYYIPRPRFEDGEPVQFGDVALVCDDIGDVVEMVFYDGSCQQVRIAFEGDSSATHYMCIDGEFVKRPAPKVLDADGVPIEVGDWVYTEAVLRRKVAKVGTERCLGMEDWDGSPWVMFGNGSWMHAHDITHREPDSLEKLRDDMRGYADGGVSCIEDDMRTFADRLTALMERGEE